MAWWRPWNHTEIVGEIMEMLQGIINVETESLKKAQTEIKFEIKT